MVELIDAAQAVDIAIRSREGFADIGHILKHLLDVDGILIDQVIQRNDQPGVAILHLHGFGQVCHKHIRQGASGEFQIGALSDLVTGTGDEFPVDVHTGQLLHAVDGELVIRRLRTARVGCGDIERKLDRLAGDRVFLAIVQHLSARARRQQHHCGHHGTQPFLHFVVLLQYFIAFFPDVQTVI